MAITPHDGSGTTFSFAGTNYTVTSITYTLGATGGGGKSGPQFTIFAVPFQFK